MADTDDKASKGADRIEVRVRLSREIHAKLLKVVAHEARAVSTYIARLVEKDMKKQRV